MIGDIFCRPGSGRIKVFIELDSGKVPDKSTYIQNKEAYKNTAAGEMEDPEKNTVADRTKDPEKNTVTSRLMYGTRSRSSLWHSTDFRTGTCRNTDNSKTAWSCGQEAGCQ